MDERNVTKEDLSEKITDIEKKLDESTEKPLFTEDELLNVRSLKLANGEDLVAVVVGYNDNCYVLRHPCRIVKVITDPQSFSSISICSKWNSYTYDYTQTISKPHVISIANLACTDLEFYIRTVSKYCLEDNQEIHKFLNKCEAIENGYSDYEWPKWMDKPSSLQVN